jgi:hypothetical protein
VQTWFRRQHHWFSAHFARHYRRIDYLISWEGPGHINFTLKRGAVDEKCFFSVELENRETKAVFSAFIYGYFPTSLFKKLFKILIVLKENVRKI